MQLYKTFVGIRGGSAVSGGPIHWKQLTMGVLVVAVVAPIVIPGAIFSSLVKILYELFYKLISKRKKNE